MILPWTQWINWKKWWNVNAGWSGDIKYACRCPEGGASDDQLHSNEQWKKRSVVSIFRAISRRICVFFKGRISTNNLSHRLEQSNPGLIPAPRIEWRLQLYQRFRSTIELRLVGSDFRCSLTERFISASFSTSVAPSGISAFFFGKFQFSFQLMSRWNW